MPLAEVAARNNLFGFRTTSEICVPSIEIFELEPSSPESTTCARWRVEAFSDVLEANAEEEERSLVEFVRNRAAGLALTARFNGVLAGTCLVVPKELEPCHPVSPWLAGLYVDPKYRLHGVGQGLSVALKAKPDCGAMIVCISIRMAQLAIIKSTGGSRKISSIGKEFLQH